MSERYIYLRLFYSHISADGSVATLVISPNSQTQDLLEEIRHNLSTKDSAQPLFLVQIRHPVTHFWVDVGETSVEGITFSALIKELHPSYPHRDWAERIESLIDTHETVMRNPVPTRGFHFISGLRGH